MKNLNDFQKNLSERRYPLDSVAMQAITDLTAAVAADLAELTATSPTPKAKPKKVR